MTNRNSKKESEIQLKSYKDLYAKIFKGPSGDYFRHVTPKRRPYTTADFNREYFIPDL